MQQLFDFAFARLDHAESKRRDFGESWNQYISQHPWDIDVRNVNPTTFEILAVTREQAPVQLSLAFSDWLATIRAALDNGLYAWVASATGREPQMDRPLRIGGQANGGIAIGVTAVVLCLGLLSLYLPGMPAALTPPPWILFGLWWALGLVFYFRIPAGIAPGEDAEHRLLERLGHRLGAKQA